MKELIILGKGPSRSYCPFDAEVWGVNNVGTCPNIKGKHIDKLFAFDTPATLDAQGVDYIRNMKAIAPIVSWQDYADEEYPYDEIVSRFGFDFFSNSISYMVALAIYEGYEKLRLYGVDMVTDSEYVYEKGGIEFWLGVAVGQGIKIEISSGSYLLKTRTGKRYGEN